MGRARAFSNLEMGFISPSGEFLSCPFCKHEEMADDLIKALDKEFYDEMSFCAYATDKLVENFGFILIDGCQEVNIQIPNIITEPQKITLELWLSRNKRFIKWFSSESINNLRRCIDWLDKGVKEVQYETR